jgi:alcohol dehydrogenase (NADP+)
MSVSLPRFEPAPDGVDPRLVPHRRLASGASMPAVGLGTFGSDHVSKEEVARAVVGAACVGYRHFDCAAVYGNEAEIGFALEAVRKGGVRREELWVTSKLWNDRHGEGNVIPAFRDSLARLRLEYLDLYLVHWPFPNYHPPGCDVHSRSPNARPYLHEEFMGTWRELEKLVDLGLVRHIGTSNMTIPKLRRLLSDARVKPSANEMELHPHFQQPELFRMVVENGIVPVGYCPLGSPGRPERDRTSEDTVDLEDEVVVRLARRHGLHPAALCVKWAVERGQVPIPFSVHREHYLSNLRAAVTGQLTHEEMEELARVDRNCRLIKGQVFLWKDGQTWKDLWDLGGEVTPP